MSDTLTRILEKINDARLEPILRHGLFDLVAEVKDLRDRVRRLEREKEETEG